MKDVEVREARGLNREEVSALSPRERQVMSMASVGLTNPQIASRLAISVHGVKFHLASVYRKLGVANRTEAAIRFVQLTSLEGD
jgi:DNA-binding CsgD family transcriptional regulator